MKITLCILSLISSLLLTTSCGVELGGNKRNLQTTTDGMAGTWKITAVKNAVGSLTHTCDDGEVVITHSPTAGTTEGGIRIEERKFNCAQNSYVTTWSLVSFTYKDATLYLNSVPVGELTSTSLVAEYYVALNTTQKFSITLSGSTYQYLEARTGTTTTTGTAQKL